MPLSGGRCYQRLAMGPGGIIAASVDGLVHFLDGTNGSLLDAIPGVRATEARIANALSHTPRSDTPTWASDGL
jgi:hypothetical protein